VISNSRQNSRYHWLGWLVLWIFVLWAAVMAAPVLFAKNDLAGLLDSFNSIMENPFRLNGLKIPPHILIFTLAMASVSASTIQPEKKKTTRGAWFCQLGRSSEARQKV
jgi:ABC-type phosphate/phosphonate transport system permease subunit